MSLQEDGQVRTETQGDAWWGQRQRSEGYINEPGGAQDGWQHQKLEKGVGQVLHQGPSKEPTLPTV